MEKENFYSNAIDDTVQFIESDPKKNWIISNELIEALALDHGKQGDVPSSLWVMGEDGNDYDWCYVLKRHMAWVEERLKKQVVDVAFKSCCDETAKKVVKNELE